MTPLTSPPVTGAESFRLLGPELVVSLGLLAIVAVALARRGTGRIAAALSVLTCAAAAAVTLGTAPAAPQGLFGGLLARDPFADFWKLLAAGATAVVALLATRARDTIDHRRGDRDAAEFHALLLGALLGCMLMAGAADLLTAYLGLELVSLMSYVLTGYSPGSRRSAEASLKYVVYGGVASGAMLYGMSLLYGLAGATDFVRVREAAAAAPPLLVLVAVVLCLAGLGYKIAIVPFHMWCPDVYEGAPAPVTAFLSVAPKAAGFALVLRFFEQAVPATVAGAPGMEARSPWLLLLLVIAALTMTLGNLAALAQENVKRLLAYSSIAHAGYLVLGVAAGGSGHRAVLFYLAVYLFMNLAAFTVVAAIADRTGAETIAAGYVGLGYRAPIAALGMTIALFSLTGLPPTAGFIGKYYLFAALVERGRAEGGAPFLLAALLAVTNSVISLYYYARILRAMYLEGRGASGAPPVGLAPVHVALVVALALPTLLLGVYWAPLDAAATAALELWRPR